MNGHQYVTACWPFYTGSLSTVLDIHPARRYNSRLVGANSAFVPGPFGLTAFRGDASSTSFLRVRDTADTEPEFFNIRTEFTLAAWVNIISSAAHKVVLGEGNGSNNVTSLLTINSTDKAEFQWTDGSFRQCIGTTVLTAGLWYHVAVTADAVNGKTVYVNGKAEGTNVLTSAPLSGGCSMIGAFPNVSATSGAGAMNGDICGIIHFTRAMPEGFIRRLYQEPLHFLAQRYQKSGDPGASATGTGVRSFFAPSL